MTILSPQKKHLKDLPNQHGFVFVGITHQGKEKQCRVVRKENGIHSVEGENFLNLSGWLSTK